MKKTLILLGGFLCVAASVFYACTKDVEDNTKCNTTKSIEAEAPIISGEILMGTMKEGDLEPTLSFNKEEYAKLITEKIEAELGKDYIFEDISIVDENPFQMDSVAVLRHTVFNVETGETFNTFIILSKNIDNKGNVNYHANEKAAKREVTCKGTNCSGCNYSKGTCTLCTNPEGVCEKTDAPAANKIGWKDVIGWGLIIVGWLVN